MNLDELGELLMVAGGIKGSFCCARAKLVSLKFVMTLLEFIILSLPLIVVYIKIQLLVVCVLRS